MDKAYATGPNTSSKAAQGNIDLGHGRLNPEIGEAVTRKRGYRMARCAEMAEVGATFKAMP